MQTSRKKYKLYVLQRKKETESQMRQNRNKIRSSKATECEER